MFFQVISELEILTQLKKATDHVAYPSTEQGSHDNAPGNTSHHPLDGIEGQARQVLSDAQAHKPLVDGGLLRVSPLVWLWRYTVWQEGGASHPLSDAEPLPHSEVLSVVKQLSILCSQDGMVHRFQPFQRLAEL